MMIQEIQLKLMFFAYSQYIEQHISTVNVSNAPDWSGPHIPGGSEDRADTQSQQLEN